MVILLMIREWGDTNWEASADELAMVSGEILAYLGLTDDPASPNARLIRDYGQRGIVSKPERRGKEAVYKSRQLLEFVAARALSVDRWPLAKIAEQFAHASDEALLKFIPDRQEENRALAVTRRLLSETGRTLSLENRSADLRAPAFMHSSSEPIRPSSVSQEFAQVAARTSSLQSELRGALRRLGLPADAPAVEQVTLIAIAPWCQVLVESSRLPRITVEEAEEVGRAITASLLDPTIRKGSK
jgi:hypothetical protein